ncbi:thioesterase [Mycobacterium heckeshornense]|uniref:PaaI family thioesterase n=1 Tax=Mycobacterium heckeshornense TaxID=110505 RepID=UPI0019437900|nr:PaaI family thioesterase [Mycobacterium heckeshornense]BCQ08681.1 thioesterase [Mycobacterium heckeshornense]
MDIAYEPIGADEHGRLAGLYGPLTDAVRDLIDATILTDVDADTIEDARIAIEAVTRKLRASQLSPTAAVRYVVDGRPLVWGNAVIGMRNPIAPPLTIHHDGGRCWSEFSLGIAYEGPPGLVHGGVCALVLDHILGEAASEGLTKPLFTGTISVKYLRGTPLGELRAEAAIERTEGVKTFVRGSISDRTGTTAEAEGIFVMPGWAREIR